MEVEAELKSLFKVSIYAASLVAYARFAAIAIRPGKFLLAALLPVICILPCLPLYFNSVQLRGNSAFFLAWLTIFKLILLAFGEGPLSPSLPMLTFIASATLPIKIKTNSKSQNISFLVFVAKAAIVAVLTFSYNYKNLMHPYLLLTIYCIHLYLALELGLITMAIIAELILPGLQLEPQFDEPYRTTSLQDFWGRRWNLMVSAILRPTVYVPVRAKLGTVAGIFATFLVSGLMHEVMVYYLTFQLPTGEMTAFFMLHSVCLVVEVSASRRGWWRPPAFVAAPLTIGFVVVTAVWLFFPPLVRTGIDELVVTEYAAIVELVKNKLSCLL